jgi:adenylate kinase family enzyme
VKINVIGTSGSGKSTLAKQIATELAIPYIEMDRLYWRPDWQGTPDDEFQEKLERRYRLRQTGCLTATTTARAR